MQNCTVDKGGCVNCLKKKFSLLKDLSDKELEFLNSKRELLDFKKGITIFKPGEDAKKLLCLNEGAVKICVEDEEGNIQIVDFKKKVDFLGFHELMSDQKYSTSATAINDVSVCAIDKDDFLSIVKNNNDLSMKIIKNLSGSLRIIEKRIVKLTQKQMRARLAGAVLELADIYGYSKEDKSLINIMIKRKELANFSNMTTANAIRTLSAFNKENLIRTERRKVWITNLKTLKKVQQEVS